jgi:hypothetical protein
MALAQWHNGMTLPVLPALEDFAIIATADISLLTYLTGLSEHAIEVRMQNGHCPYVAWLRETPAVYGWVATQTAQIGELNLVFDLPRNTTYLWDFVTLPAWRGMGIYPHLLQNILVKEHARADNFWIIHAPENHSSAQGITRAGFTAVGELSFLKRKPGIGLVEQGRDELARQGADLLQVELLSRSASNAVAPCWRCVLQLTQDGKSGQPDCWTTECGCSQRP